MPKSLTANLGWIATVLAILGALGTYQHQAQQAAIERDRDRQRLRVLEHVVVSEFPQYTASFDWSDEK